MKGRKINNDEIALIVIMSVIFIVLCMFLAGYGKIQNRELEMIRHDLRIHEKRRLAEEEKEILDLNRGRPIWEIYEFLCNLISEFDGNENENENEKEKETNTR